MRSLNRVPVVAALVAAVGAVPAAVAAQRAPRDSVEPGAELAISLVTVGPGAEIWERFGHNAILVRDTVRGTGTMYNYGIFDFQSEDFLLRFIQGRMLYRVEGFPPDLSLYTGDNRSVWIQDLNFTPAQRNELRGFLEWNDLPENRNYRYDYYRDNCSTRVRDALDNVLRGQIQSQTDRFAAGTTYRFHTQRLTTNDVPIYTGLLIALGLPVDRSLTLWEEMFLPTSLQQHLREVTVTGPDGNAQPFVTAERTVYESTAVPPAEVPPSWGLRYLLVGIILAVVLLWLGIKAPQSRIAYVAFSGAGTLWALVVGILGTVLLGLWVVTDHAAAYWNENLFMFNPLALALAVTLPPAALGSAGSKPLARRFALATALLAAFGFVLQPLPWFDQINGQLYALVVLPHIAVAIGVYRVAAAEPDRDGDDADVALQEQPAWK